MAAPYTREELDDLLPPNVDRDRVLATIQQGFAPDDTALSDWAEAVLREAILIPRSERYNPLENLTAALDVTKEFDVAVAIHLSRRGRLTISGWAFTEPAPAEGKHHQVYDNDVVANDAALALIRWLWSVDRSRQ